MAPAGTSCRRGHRASRRTTAVWLALWAEPGGHPPETIEPMSYDPELAERIRDLVEGEDGIAERRMFGGLAFLVNGNMSVAASGQGGLLVRMSPDESGRLVDNEQVRPMVMRGRPMRGWLRVDATAVSDTDLLGPWVERGVAFARSLPPKD